VTDDPGRDARLAEIAAHKKRQAKLIRQYGMPEHVSASDALAKAMTALVPVDPRVTAGDVYAFIYRDEAAADGWADSNLTHNGVPTLAKVPLPDGRVIGILDLRPALQRTREES
jgi:hypothetical protein